MKRLLLSILAVCFLLLAACSTPSNTTTTTTLTTTATTTATPPAVSNSTSTSLPVIRPTTIWKSADYTGWYLFNLEVKPSTVTVGQNVNVSAWLIAPGIVVTEVTAILSVNGERESTKTFYVEGDSTDFISFTFSPNVAGKHRISFGAILTRDLDYYIVGEHDLYTTLVVIE